MKVCENCHKNIATVHLTEIKQGKSVEMHLCEECAKKFNVPQKTPLTVNELLGVLMEPGREKTAEADAGLACPGCGITLADFKKKGRCGCANDYKVFKESLVPILEKFHGSTKYIGKVPGSRDGQPVFLRELVSLRQRLKDVIRSEEYEEAAKIRDRISELEKLASGSGIKGGEESDQ